MVRGLPTPTVVWFRGDIEIIPDNTHSITFIPETGESKLIILKATEVDQNTYTVKATNKYGKAQCRANVIIRKFHYKINIYIYTIKCILIILVLNNKL